MIIANAAPFFTSPRDWWAAPCAAARALLRRVTEAGRDARPIESTVSLNSGATTWVDQPLGRRLSCESGLLWLCFDGEPLDIVLEPGESHLCVKGTVLSIHALSPGMFRLA